MGSALKFGMLPVVLLGLSITPSLAQAAPSGGVDPTSGLAALTPWMLKLAGAAIILICGVKGVHAVAEGRHFMPYIGAAVGGIVLCFGAYYLLTAYGVGGTT